MTISVNHIYSCRSTYIPIFSEAPLLRNQPPTIRSSLLLWIAPAYRRLRRFCQFIKVIQSDFISLFLLKPSSSSTYLIIRPRNLAMRTKLSKWTSSTNSYTDNKEGWRLYIGYRNRWQRQRRAINDLITKATTKPKRAISGEYINTSQTEVYIQPIISIDRWMEPIESLKDTLKLILEGARSNRPPSKEKRATLWHRTAKRERDWTPTKEKG